MEFTVLDALATEGFWGATILAGWSGLRRRVHGITVAEVPDSANWLEGGEVVLTTGFVFRDQPEQFAAWIDSLAEAGAAAVAVKGRRFLGSVPAEGITVAEARQLPLVALRHRVSWPAIIGPVMKRQWAVSEGQAPPAFRDVLFNIFEGKQGFPSVARALARISGRPVLLQGPALDLHAAGLPDDESAFLLKYRCRSSAMRRLQQEVGRKRSESGLPPWELESYPIRWRSDASVEHPAPDDVIEYFFPLVNDDEDVGYLSVVWVGREPDPPSLQDLQYAAALVSLGFQRLHRSGERPLSLGAAALLQALKSDQALAVPSGVREALEQRGAIAAVRPLGGRWSVIHPGRTTLSTRGIVDDLVLDLESWHRQWDPFGLLTYEDDVFYFLLTEKLKYPGDSSSWSSRDASTQAHPRTLQQEWLSALRQFVSRRYGIDHLVAGFSEWDRGRTFYRQAWIQSRHSLTLASDPSIGSDQAVWYEDLGIYRLLVGTGSAAHSRSLETIQAFCARYLDPLQAAENGDEAPLVETLRTFFAHNGNLTRAAAQLYIHRNTMRYRLRRIRELTGLDVSTSEGYATLYLALRLQHLLKVQEGLPLVQTHKSEGS